MGQVGVVFDRKGRFLAAGLLDPEGPIRLRVLVHGQAATIGPALFRERLERALATRVALLGDRQTTGVRLLSGENDGMPGLVADRYGDVVVLKVYSLCWAPWLDDLAELFQKRLGATEIRVLAARRVSSALSAPEVLRRPSRLDLEGATVDTGAPDEPILFREAGLLFEAHPGLGHKTGFYLDQRDNRARVEAWVRTELDSPARRRRPGFRALNVFSYSGGFSLAAARGGATEVVSVDASGPALQQAARHFELNAEDPRIAACQHQTRRGDAFQILEDLALAGERFDLVVMDPPSFAKEKSQVRPALSAYQRLTRLGLGVLERGGLLVQASCSTRVSDEDFFTAIHGAARRAGRPLTDLERTGHPVDHPVTTAEGAYLKALFARG